MNYRKSKRQNYPHIRLEGQGVNIVSVTSKTMGAPFDIHQMYTGARSPQMIRTV